VAVAPKLSHSIRCPKLAPSVVPTDGVFRCPLAESKQGLCRQNGTGGERALLSAMTAIRTGAEAQIELANAAIAMIQGCAGVADDAALASLSDGAPH
jgi:hypothetical protein